MRNVALITVMHKRGCDGFYEKSLVHIHEIKEGSKEGDGVRCHNPAGLT